MGVIQVNVLKIFASPPGGKSAGVSEFYYFYFSSLNSLNLVLILGTISNGHLGTWTGCFHISKTRLRGKHL